MWYNNTCRSSNCLTDPLPIRSHLPMNMEGDARCRYNTLSILFVPLSLSRPQSRGHRRAHGGPFTVGYPGPSRSDICGDKDVPCEGMVGMVYCDSSSPSDEGSSGWKAKQSMCIGAGRLAIPWADEALGQLFDLSDRPLYVSTAIIASQAGAALLSPPFRT
jgi:hypothetical protein